MQVHIKQGINLQSTYVNVILVFKWYVNYVCMWLHIQHWMIKLHYTIVYGIYTHNPICISIYTVNGRYSLYVLYWNTTRSN